MFQVIKSIDEAAVLDKISFLYLKNKGLVESGQILCLNSTKINP